MPVPEPERAGNEAAEFIVSLGAAVCWPIAPLAQQAMRRVAVIMVQHETDSIGQGRLNALGLEVPPSLHAVADQVVE